MGLLLASGADGAPALAQGTRAPAVGVKCASVQATQRASAAVDADKEVVKLYDEGVKAANTGQWEKARTALLEAFNRMPHCKIAANLGWAELMAGKPRDAAEHLSLFLREAQEVSAADRQEAEKMLAKAKAMIGTVTVRVDAEGAEVLVDGQKVGISPLAEPVFVEPGRRTFEARKAGLSPGRQGIEVAAGAAPVVEIRTAEKAELPMPPRPTPGPAMPTPTPESGSQRSKALIYAGISVSAGLAAVGAGTAIGAALTRKASLDDWEANKCKSADPVCMETYDSQERRRLFLGNTAIWACLGAGVIGGATAIYYGVVGSGSASKSMPRATLSVTAQGGGIVLAGSF